MNAKTAWTRSLIGISTAGMLLANGCLARLEQNLDRVLAPDAIENALVLPLSSVFPLARFFQAVL